MDLHPDFRDLLTAFGDARVRYLLIGGYAVAFHAEPRYTKDIDLWIDPDPDNVARAVVALDAFGAPATVIRDLQSARDDEIVYMGVPPIRIDPFKSIPGVEFAPCYDRHVQVVHGLTARSR